YENTGTSNAPAFLERSGTDSPFPMIDLGYLGAIPSLADVDGDGDLDAVLNQHLLINTGTVSAPAFEEVSGASNPFLDVLPLLYLDLGDLDGDGDLDVVGGVGVSGIFSLYENTGSSSTASFMELTESNDPFMGLDVGSRSTPTLADLDGDADLDAIIGESLGTLLFFENTGSSRVPAFLEISGSANPFAGIPMDSDHPRAASSDLDGDGDLDILVGMYDGTMVFLENTGASTSPVFLVSGTASPFSGIDVGYLASPALADIDDDGDADLVVGSQEGTLKYFQNSGNSSAPVFVEITGSANPFSTINVQGSSQPTLSDLDEDDDLDLLLGSSSGLVRYFENIGTIKSPNYVVVSSPVSGVDGFSAPTLADLDGDGDLDVLVGQERGGLVFSRSLGFDLFRDGFEVGTTARWSDTIIEP
ncbi:MAG: FG-GAP-like repeat-containing protein, partial [Thermoanaerobaculia bacterium]|nr:FG-GAP-like repeat-containing protein [Thermoanaerobaculia bacterium]